MEMDRRTLLKGLAVAGASAVAVPAFAEPRKQAPSDATGLLYDSTLCIGCKACVVACKEANGLPADTSGYGNGLYDSPGGLNEFTKNSIELNREGDEYAYVKRQCMHCVDPACVGACMLQSLVKGQNGIVTWDADRCVGCRYCQVVCPFNVPKFEWANNAPKIVKCELCRHRLAEGKEPACSEVCPRQAVIYGKRADLLDEAHRRLKEKPDLYIQKVYGEFELGGTQCLYLSHVPFDKLGFRFDTTESVPATQQAVQHWVYRGVVAPLVLLFGAMVFRNRKAIAGEEPLAEDRG